MRKKLGKLMGVENKYTGVLGEDSHNGLNVVIRDVKHNGKYVCDHVWISKTKGLQDGLEGTEVKFIATATTYTDSHGVRKNGLHKCHSIFKEHETHDKLKNDYQHYTRRKK